MLFTTQEEKMEIAKIELAKQVEGFAKFDERTQNILIYAFCMGMCYQQILDKEQENFEKKIKRK